MLRKKEKKRLYDIEYRRKNKDKLKKTKAEYHKKTYNPEKAKIERKLKMPAHIEYCRQPKYKEWKKEYDRLHRLKKKYGEYWECMEIVIKIDVIFKELVPEKYERYKIRGTIKRNMARAKIRRLARKQ